MGVASAFPAGAPLVVELGHEGRRSDVGCRVGHAGVVAAVVDAVMRVWRQERLRRRIEHGCNVDDKFLSNCENKEYNVIRDTHDYVILSSYGPLSRPLELSH
jgi:hypothetical protein